MRGALRHLLAGCALALLLPAAAHAAVAVKIGTGTSATGTSNALDTTGTVAVGGTLVLVTYTTGTNNTPVVSGLTCSLGGADVISSQRPWTYYCPAPSGLTSPQHITQASGSSGPAIMIAYALPASVGAFDLGDATDSATGGGSVPNFTTPVPNHTPEYILIDTYVSNNADFSPDARDVVLDTVTVGTASIFTEERVVNPATAGIPFNATMPTARTWMSMWTTFAYTPGGAPTAHNLTTLGAGN